MTRRSPREIDRRLDDLEQDEHRPELRVTITRHDYENDTLDADESEYELETVSSSDWFEIRDAVTIADSDTDDGDRDD